MLRLMATKNALENPEDAVNDLDFVQEIFLQNIHKSSFTEANELSDCMYTLRNLVKFFKALALKEIS